MNHDRHRDPGMGDPDRGDAPTGELEGLRTTPTGPRSLGAELRAVVFLYGTVAALAWLLRGLGS